jgi:hypothetical protein
MMKEAVGDESKNQNDSDADKQIKKKIRQVKYFLINKTTLLEENERKTRAHNIVGAGRHSQKGRQSAVREKMRRDQLNENHDEESDQESFKKNARACHQPHFLCSFILLH